MKPLNVTEINNYINKTLSTDLLLADVSIEGEISNFTHHYSGHMYFNLKDENSKIKCVMFKSYNQKLDISIEEGMKIIARGGISVYARDGIYQLYVKHMEDNGLGELYKEFEKLKNQLEKEGLFDTDIKKEIPKMPKKIGVVTSATGAAVKDIITVINRRFPSTNVLIYPSLVQGKEAAKTVIKGLEYLDEREDVDLIIFGRGGGSMEELFAFNDEELARTIYRLKTPNISAIGHEIDFTIADFVSDLRAATPSAAAELSVPNVNSYITELNSLYINIKRNTISNVNRLENQLDLLANELKHLNPTKSLYDKKQDLDNIFRKIKDEFSEKNRGLSKELNILKSKLILSNPKLGIEKGFGLIINKKGKIIKSIVDVEIKEALEVIFKDGSLNVNVESKKEEEI